MYEIETGSIVTYPCPYRIIDVTGNSLNIRTEIIEHIDYELPDGMNFQAYAASLIEVGFSEMLPAIIHEYHHNIVKTVTRWMRFFVSVPDAERLSELLTTHLSSAGVSMLLAHYAGNENYVHDASFQKQELLKSIDNLIRDLAKESSGSFAGITERFLHRMDVVKKAKQAASSIWENTMAASTDNRQQKINLGEPVNDLYLTLNMEDPSVKQREEEFYTQLIPEKEENAIKNVMATVSRDHLRLISQFAILDNRKKKYILE